MRALKVAFKRRIASINPNSIAVTVDIDETAMVIHTYCGKGGKPMFLVHTEDGEIFSIDASSCKVIYNTDINTLYGD